MKVNGSDDSIGVRGLLRKVEMEEGRNERQVDPRQGPWGEKVDISPQAREIQRIKAALEQIPEVRSKKVEEIRRLVETGQYKVDLQAVSDKLLQALIMGEL